MQHHPVAEPLQEKNAQTWGLPVVVQETYPIQENEL